VQKSRAPSMSPGESSEPYSLQSARKNAPVTLYSQPDCDACDRARRLLNARGVPFKEVSVLTEKQIEEMRQAGGGTSVPVLLVGGAVQQGVDESAFHAMLDAAGYPKTGVLPPRAQAEPKAPTQAEAPKPVKPAAEAEPAPSGPYTPGAARQRQKK
jgi:glutaredoxin